MKVVQTCFLPCYAMTVPPIQGNVENVYHPRAKLQLCNSAEHVMLLTFYSHIVPRFPSYMQKLSISTSFLFSLYAANFLSLYSVIQFPFNSIAQFPTRILHYSHDTTRSLPACQKGCRPKAGCLVYFTYSMTDGFVDPSSGRL